MTPMESAVELFNVQHHTQEENCDTMRAMGQDLQNIPHERLNKFRVTIYTKETKKSYENNEDLGD